MKKELDTVKMINHVSIAGVLKPEKLAEGHCPNCSKAITVWITEKGLELSSNSHGKVYRTAPKDNK